MQSCVQNCSETAPHMICWIFNEIWSSVCFKEQYNLLLLSPVVANLGSAYSTVHSTSTAKRMSEVGAQEEILKVDPATPLWEIFLTKSQPKCPAKRWLVQCLSAASEDVLQPSVIC
jgi:hypothetical protein